MSSMDRFDIAHQAESYFSFTWSHFPLICRIKSRPPLRKEHLTSFLSTTSSNPFTYFIYRICKRTQPALQYEIVYQFFNLLRYPRPFVVELYPGCASKRRHGIWFVGFAKCSRLDRLFASRSTLFWPQNSAPAHTG